MSDAIARPSFEQCTDDGPFDEAAWSTEGHHDPSFGLLLALGRAIRYDTGYCPAETVDLLSSVRWHQGYCGKHPSKYDLIPCDAAGEAESDCDDDGDPVICTDVSPTTWGIVKLDAHRSRRGMR